MSRESTTACVPAGSKQDPQGGIFKTNSGTTSATSDDNIQTCEEKDTLVCMIQDKQLDDKGTICGSGHVRSHGCLR